ncbi:MAG: hypothetical protein SRB2_00277 [Desulfobacteraceae bacterium Eth-SRB2]|nr:MAG: hypothetical protein SRB2_00277 [Desulfobacteraceae bacterium Eth-SRB2]
MEYWNVGLKRMLFIKSYVKMKFIITQFPIFSLSLRRPESEAQNPSLHYSNIPIVIQLGQSPLSL